MVCEVHELVDEVRLPELRREGTELLVGGEVASSRGLPDGALLKHLHSHAAVFREFQRLQYQNCC